MIDRKGFLASGAAALTLAPHLAAAANGPVDVLYAGSLVTIFERTIFPALKAQGIEVRGEARGSVALANLIKSGLRSCDLFVSADPAVIDTLMGKAGNDRVAWYATFATTKLVVGYSPASPFAHAFVQAARGERQLAEVLVQPGLRLGRTDPALDPKGYRTLLAVQLLGRQSNIPEFAHKVLGGVRNEAQILPEETLLVRLESGELDAAFLYSTESVARHLPAVDLPPSANLGDPAYAKTYASASVDVGGTTRTGAAIAYALTIPRDARNLDGAVAVAQYLLAGPGRAVMSRSGIGMLSPIVSGDAGAVPAGLREALGLGAARPR